MSSITLRFFAETGTPNCGCRVNGGTVMKWIDQAGYVCATGWAKRDCVMVSVGDICFHRPVMIGDLVEVEARLAYTGKTSMNLSVEMRSGDMKTGQMEIVTDCLAVFVALDSDGKTIPYRPVCLKRPATLPWRNASRPTSMPPVPRSRAYSDGCDRPTRSSSQRLNSDVGTQARSTRQRCQRNNPPCSPRQARRGLSNTSAAMASSTGNG